MKIRLFSAFRDRGISTIGMGKTTKTQYKKEEETYRTKVQKKKTKIGFNRDFILYLVELKLEYNC